MKKLLLILSAVFVSAITYGANNYSQANPFAYDLSCELRNNGNTLALTYTLNADAVTSNTYNTTHGVKINLIDEQQNSYTIRHITDPSSSCVKKGRRTVEIQVSEIPAAFKDKPITWEIEVFGNTKRTIPKQITQATDNNRPLLCHGVAVSKNPQTNYAGKIFVAEASNGDATNRPWLVGKGPSLLEYNITDLSYVNFHKKVKQNGTSSGVSNFSTALPEPHRVKISEDGRIFVTSYHNNSTTAVWEYKGDNNYNQIIYRNNTLSGDPSKNDRVIGMDVKGSGDNLTILLCYLNTSNAQLRCYEYVVGNKVQNAYNSGTLKCTYQLNSSKINDIINYDSGKGAFFIKKGLVSVAYGAKDTESIWIGLDYFWSVPTYTSMLLHFDANGTKLMEYTTPSATARYGGGGIAVYIDDKTKNEVVVMGTAQPSNATYTGEFRGYEISADGTEIVEENKFCVAAPTTAMINDFSIDYANNLYLVSSLEANGLNNNGTGRLIQYALPYDGKRVTRSKSSTTVSDPVPNILATNLKCEPAGTTDNYTFSFITNTKPTIAEIRFYRKESLVKMENNIATIHADNYQKEQAGHETQVPDYVYTFTGDELKEGLMSVTLKMVGGTGDITGEKALPPGEMYWSVYVESSKRSRCFGPIYRSEKFTTGKYHPLHATVNNYPATDMFGSLIVTNNPEYGTERPNTGLLIYNLNPNSNSVETRYVRTDEYLNNNTLSLNYPRRMAVAPDGKVYIADEGKEGGNAGNHTTPTVHSDGGVKLWDPATGKISLFHDGVLKTSTGVALYNDNNTWKLYATDTYQEFYLHGSHYTGTPSDPDNVGTKNTTFGQNGFYEYMINSAWTGWNGDPIRRGLKKGDASGNIALVAMNKGIWLCQHREHNVAIKIAHEQPLPDNLDSYILSFVPHNSNVRTWRSAESNGIKWNETKAPLTRTYTWESPRSPWSHGTDKCIQSTPGGGIAYKKIKNKNGNEEEYLYVVRHDGNIVKIQILNWGSDGKTPNLEYKEVLTTPATTKYDITVKHSLVWNGKTYVYPDQNWHTAFINSMEFDYAGNLVTVTGNAIYHTGNAVGNATHEIIVYTMPYDRTNAQEIRAPESCIYIPERLHQMAMEEVDIQGVLNRHTSDGACAVDLYRPLQGGEFNTICLPFAVPMNHENNPLAGSEVREFTGATIESIGGENILCLQFAEVSTIQCNIPYIIKPQQNIKQIMRFNWPVTLATNTTVNPNSKTFDTDNTITYQGILPKKDVKALYDQTTKLPLRLILVADNRLAVLTGDGQMYGFRGYFDLAKPLPPGTVAKISAKKDTPTNTTIVVDGKKVNIDKYLREGRVYIRMGDSLYTVDGQLVK